MTMAQTIAHFEPSLAVDEELPARAGAFLPRKGEPSDDDAVGEFLKSSLVINVPIFFWPS